MKELAEALPWVAFWLVVAVYIRCEHHQFMAGFDSAFWSHKTPEEQRLREAIIAEREAASKKAAP